MEIKTVDLSTYDNMIGFYQNCNNKAALNNLNPKVNEFVKQIFNALTGSFINGLGSCTESKQCLVSCKKNNSDSELIVDATTKELIMSKTSGRHSFSFKITNGFYERSCYIESTFKDDSKKSEEIFAVLVKESQDPFVSGHYATNPDSPIQEIENSEGVLSAFDTYMENVKNHFSDKPADSSENEDAQTGWLLGGVVLAALGAGLYAKHKSRQTHNPQRMK